MPLDQLLFASTGSIDLDDGECNWYSKGVWWIGGKTSLKLYLKSQNLEKNTPPRAAACSYIRFVPCCIYCWRKTRSRTLLMLLPGYVVFATFSASQVSLVHFLYHNMSSYLCPDACFCHVAAWRPDIAFFFSIFSLTTRTYYVAHFLHFTSYPNVW